MHIQPGTRLGPYEIIARAGAGGMGQVFRAKDTRLDRTVAVKTLPPDLSNDVEMRMRFRREALAISALNHPNICALYDVGEQEGVDYLVMEYMEGETLEERLGPGPLPLSDAVRYAIDIAAALERAHHDDIVHRDLKPGNVMLSGGRAKLLDFGLALRAPRPTLLLPGTSDKTAPKALTGQGMIIGTLPYMAPELLRGAVADVRTDMFAFGALMYEMLAGRPAFSGESSSSLIAAIVSASPPPLPRDIPPELEHVIARCLDKDREGRWQSAHDVKIELQWIASQLTASQPVVLPPPAPRLLPWILAASAAMIAIAIAIALAVIVLRPKSAPAARTIHAQILPPSGKQFSEMVTTLSISPDGNYVTFHVAGDERLWLREVSTNSVRAIEGTDGAEFPFWSPDSRAIAFFSEGKLKKVSLSEATPVTLCEAEPGRSGSWNSKGVILFSPSSVSALYRVPDTGGEPQPLTKLGQNETTHRWASFLPDGNHFLYMAGNYKDPPGNDRTAIYVSSLDAPHKRTFVLHARSNAFYAAGHLIYGDKRTLQARPFDAEELELTGEPFRLAVDVETDRQFFRVAFDVSQDGTLVYHSSLTAGASRLIWSAEDGSRTEIMRPNLDIVDFRLSHDQQKAVARVQDETNGGRDLYLLDLQRRTARPLTFAKDNFFWSPIWSPDDTRVIYSQGVAPKMTIELVSKRVDGGALPEVLVRSKGTLAFNPSDWSPDGKYVLYDAQDELTKEDTADVWMVEARAGASPRRLIGGEGQQCCGSFSPDGKWIVYTSSESGRSEIYAVRFPDLSGKTQISIQGAASGRWTNEHEILMTSSNSTERVAVTVEDGLLRIGTSVPIERPQGTIASDTHDGRRALYLIADDNAYLQSITLMTDWQRGKR